jgi:hypothetical protein
MATLGSRFIDLVDVYRQSPEGENAAMVIELLAQTNPILNDLVVMECNSGSKHLHSIRTRLPEVSWGALYEGIAQSKSAYQSVEDTTGFLEGLSQVDTRVLELAGDKRNQVKLNEDMGFIESLNQEMASGLFYHDTANSPRKFKGLSARYAAHGDKTDTTSARQVVNGGGSGSDNTSVWFVTWGERFTCGIYPEGTQAGIQRSPKGEQRVLDADGNPYFVEEDLYRWHMGLAVKDWRYNSRICNIDVSNLQAGNVDIWGLMRQAYYRLHSRKVTRAGANFAEGAPAMRQVIYMNSDVLEALDAESTEKGGNDSLVRLQRREIEGEEVLTYRNIPIMETDAILSTEEAVPAAA